jgi:hypothetical protein
VALARADGLDATLMTKGGNIWYDSGGYCWVGPNTDTVTDYLADLCRELAEMGFDEILLDNAGYPDFGESYVLATDQRRPEDLTAPVTAFYEKVSAALEGSGVRLSIRTSEAALTGENGESGVTPQALAQWADRVWLEQPEDLDGLVELLTQAGMDDAAQRLVLVDGEAGQGSWATLN